MGLTKNQKIDEAIISIKVAFEERHHELSLDREGMYLCRRIAIFLTMLGALNDEKMHEFLNTMPHFPLDPQKNKLLYRSLK